MRFVSAAAAFAAVLAFSAAAHAETRIFIIANGADGYGIDRCLAAGAACGAAAAAAYCRSREFAKAGSYRRVERQEITGAVPTSPACRSGACNDFIAIECLR